MGSDLVKLVGLDCGVGPGYGVASYCLVVEGAFVLVGIAVEGAEDIAAAALKACEPYPLTAGAAAVWLLRRRGSRRRGRWDRILLRNRNNRNPKFGRTCLSGGRGFTNSLAIAARTEIVVFWGPEEATVVGAENGAFRRRAACVLLQLRALP